MGSEKFRGVFKKMFFPVFALVFNFFSNNRLVNRSSVMSSVAMAFLLECRRAATAIWVVSVLTPAAANDGRRRSDAAA